MSAAVICNNYQHQIVSDLVWLISSPPMMKPKYQRMLPTFPNGWLAELDREPYALQLHLASRNMRMLGTYCEALWEFYLSQGPGLGLAAKNLQVFDNNQTLGEFDFIYQKQGATEFRHLEVAVKYYLGYPPLAGDSNNCGSSPQSSWLGPATKDRLDKKWHKLCEHQSQLSKMPAGHQSLADKGLVPVQPEVEFLGYLFYPLLSEMAPPKDAHPAHNRGHWLFLHQVASHLPDDYDWMPLDKPHWMAPVSRRPDLLSRGAAVSRLLEAEMAKRKRPVLLAGFNASEPDLQAKSERLVFVVPDSWPGEVARGF